MKRKALWTVVGLTVLVVAAITARTGFRGGHRWCHQGWHHRGPLGYVARELKLSDAQVAQVRSIVTEERPKVAALLKDLLDQAHQMPDTTADGKIDEARVRAIATAEGSTFAELLVEKEHFKSRIYATVLNKTQRQSADRMQQRWLDRFDRAVSRLQNSSR